MAENAETTKECCASMETSASTTPSDTSAEQKRKDALSDGEQGASYCECNKQELRRLIQKFGVKYSKFGKPKCGECGHKFIPDEDKRPCPGCDKSFCQHCSKHFSTWLAVPEDVKKIDGAAKDEIIEEDDFAWMPPTTVEYCQQCNIAHDNQLKELLHTIDERWDGVDE